MKRLNIGVICYPTVGGSGVVATELGKKMADRGHSVHFITSERPFRLTQLSDNVQFHRVEIEGYAVFQYPPYDIALANRIAQVIQSEGLDVLHVHYAVPHAIAASLGRHMASSTIPIVTTLHGTDVTILGEQASLKDTVRYGIEQSDRTTAVSEALRRDTYRLIGPDAPIDVIYNFIDHDAYYVDDEERERVRREFGFDEEELVFIHVSNFREVKRTDYVLNSFAHILKEKKAHLLLVGDGPEMDEREKQVRSLGIEPYVHFTGKRTDVRSLLNASDIMLHLSDKEAFGLVILEAFACGVPVIGTNVGGIPEVIEHHKNGQIVPLDDEQAVVRAALSLVESPERYASFQREAIRTAQTIFHEDRMVDAYERVYEDVLLR